MIIAENSQTSDDTKLDTRSVRSGKCCNCEVLSNGLTMRGMCDKKFWYQSVLFVWLLMLNHFCGRDVDFRTAFLWVSYWNGGDNVLIMQISWKDNELAHPWVKFKTFYQKIVCQVFQEVKTLSKWTKIRLLSNLVMLPLINFPHYDNKSCDLSHINKRYHNLLSHASKLHPNQTNELYAKCLKCNILQ